VQDAPKAARKSRHQHAICRHKAPFPRSAAGSSHFFSTLLGDAAAAKALHSNVIEGKDNEGEPYFKLVSPDIS
jgi:hypothetical protein